MSGETRRLSGMTAAHNAVRANVQSGTALPLLTWSAALATYAQVWADAHCGSPAHRTAQDLQQKNYGENIAGFASSATPVSDAQKAVDGWAAENACWTVGTFMGTDSCDTACYTKLNSDGCGHYTAMVWRTTTQVDWA